MRKTLFSAFLCILIISIQAQVQQDWARKFVGSGTDNAAGIAADHLGNVWICGNNNWGLGNPDMYVVRYNSAGTQTAGFLFNSANAEQGRAITTDGANNVYAVGVTSVNNGPKDIMIVKYNSSAVQQWVATFNTPQGWDDDANAVAVDGSGNVYVTGSMVKDNAFEYDYLTVKFNAAGVVQWYALYNGTANAVDIANDIAVDGAGNVYVTGLSSGQRITRLGTLNTGYDYVTIKYNASGVQQWAVRYVGSSGNDEAKAIALDASGNVYVTGHSPATGSSTTDCVTIKYDNNGTSLWTQRYAGSAGVNDEGNDIAVDGSGNVYVSGYANSGNGTSSVLGLKYNSAGTPLWGSLYSAGSGTNNIGKKMGLDAYANMYIAAETNTPGVTSSDFITVKFTTNGALAWAVRYNSPENAFDTPTGIAVVMPNAPPGSAVNAVIYVSGQSNSDVATVKYSQPAVICCAFNTVNVTAEELRGRFSVSNYPNPARTYTNIEYELAADAKVTIDVYDVFGRKVTTLVNGSKKAGTHIVKLNSAGLANGLYNYQFTIQSGEHTFRQTKEIVVQK